MFNISAKHLYTCIVTFLFSEMAVQTISESVYVGLCLKIGTPKQVAIRRDVVDIYELLERKVKRSDQGVIMVSGSQREGFRFKNSDIDIMICYKNHQVF